MRCSERVFAGVSGMNVVIRDKPVLPGLVVWICGCGKAAPADALACLGDDLFIVHFIEGLDFDHVFPGRRLHEEVRVVLLAGFPEQAELVKWWLDPADNVRVLLKDDGELPLGVAVEGVCRIV